MCSELDIVVTHLREIDKVLYEFHDCILTINKEKFSAIVVTEHKSPFPLGIHIITNSLDYNNILSYIDKLKYLYRRDSEYKPNKDIQPPKYQVVSEGYKPI